MHAVILITCYVVRGVLIPVAVASFSKEINSRLAKRPLVFNGRLANPEITS